jgi:hypothetical protein
MKTIRSLGMIYNRAQVRPILGWLMFSPTGETEGNPICRSPEVKAEQGS